MAKILIIDDHETNRDFLATLLGYKGHVLLQASDGAGGLSLARAEHPDLILTDILMPTMDGYEFTRLLRTDPSIANTPIIFCTAHYLEQEACKLAQTCGVEHVLFKPCEAQLVLQTVDTALGIATVQHDAPPLQEFDRQHLQLLTNKLSRSTDELQMVNLRLDALIEINLQLSAEDDPRLLLKALCSSARSLIGARYCAVAVGNVQRDTLDHFFTSGMDPEVVLGMGKPSLRSGVLAKMLTERRGCRLQNSSGSLTIGGLPAGFPLVGYLVGAPIASLKHVYGWLCLGDKMSGNEFSEEDERVVNILGAQVGRIYENNRLYVEAQSQAAVLQREAALRKHAQEKAQAQLERLALLDRITRAIGERQDLNSIFQVVIRCLEDSLPIDFGCICLYEPGDSEMVVTSVGMRSGSLARELAMTELARIPIDNNGLSACVAGQLVYEPDIRKLDRPFPSRLALGGLQAMVAAPLLPAEDKIFGILIAARLQAHSFSSGDCEFLRQLSEHVALATRQAQLYGALQQAYDDLRQSQQAVMQQERLRALGQMASGVAHDINNAISPVALYSEVLLEHENLSERGRNYLSIIRRSIQDVADTVSRMRQFYRPHQPDPWLLPINLNHIIEQVIEVTRVRWRDLPQQHGIVIDVETYLAANLPNVMGTESDIRDAFTNLVFNAVDAMPAGGVLTIRTAMTTDTSGREVVQVEVSDTGLGMDDETRRRCFEPFFTTKGERGTGLGLAMVYGMVQRHEAEIDIESAPGKGTTLRLSFPVCTNTRGPAAESTALLRPTRPLRVLSVDDDPVILESLRNALQGDGHWVMTTDGGQAGIDAFLHAEERGEKFDAVITDLGMPYMDGRKVAAAVKTASSRTPVILLTGWGQRLSAHNEVPMHVDRILNKPPKLHELRRVLAELTNPPCDTRS